MFCCEIWVYRRLIELWAMRAASAMRSFVSEFPVNEIAYRLGRIYFWIFQFYPIGFVTRFRNLECCHHHRRQQRGNERCEYQNNFLYVLRRFRVESRLEEARFVRLCAARPSFALATNNQSPRETCRLNKDASRNVRSRLSLALAEKDRLSL